MFKQDNGYGLSNTLSHRAAERYFDGYDGLDKHSKPVNFSHTESKRYDWYLKRWVTK